MKGCRWNIFQWLDLDSCMWGLYLTEEKLTVIKKLSWRFSGYSVVIFSITAPALFVHFIDFRWLLLDKKTRYASYLLIVRNKLQNLLEAINRPTIRLSSSFRTTDEPTENRKYAARNRVQSHKAQDLHRIHWRGNRKPFFSFVGGIGIWLETLRST